MDSINPDDRDVPLFSIIYQTISMIYWILTGTGARRVNNLSFTLISRNYLDSVQEQLEWNYTNSNFLLTFFFLYTIYSILNFTTKRKTNRNRQKIRFFPGFRKKRRRRRKECRERHAKRVDPTWSNKLTKDQDAKKREEQDFNTATRERHGNNFPATTSNNFHTCLSRTSANKFPSWSPPLTTTATPQRRYRDCPSGKWRKERITVVLACPLWLSVLSHGERKNLPSRPATGTKVRRAARRVERVVGRFHAITSFRFSKPACWSRVKEHVCGTAIKY